MEGKETVCINATVCFDVKLKSKEDEVYTTSEYNKYTKYFGAGGQYICSHMRKSSKILYFPCDRDLHITLQHAEPWGKKNLLKKEYVMEPSKFWSRNHMLICNGHNCPWIPSGSPLYSKQPDTKNNNNNTCSEIKVWKLGFRGAQFSFLWFFTNPLFFLLLPLFAKTGIVGT